MDFLKNIKNVNPINFQAIPVVKSLPKSVWETYSAFANTFGGTIVLGMSLRKTGEFHVSGVDNPDRILKEFWTTVRNNEKVSATLVKQKDVKVETAEGLKVIIIAVPRAERHSCPVYIEDSLYGGTFRRSANGDRYCTSAEVAEMIRNSTDDITDMEPIESMDLSVLNINTINIYRAHLKATKPRHPWIDLPLEEFLYAIGAGSERINGAYHPTRAGLLMFGNEYSIVKVFSSFYLEYYEGNIDVAEISDRLMSSSGEWSGNVFDFYLLITDRMIAKPHELMVGESKENRGNIDNAMNDIFLDILANTDYDGRGGVVVEKTRDSVKISSSGLLREPVNTERTIGSEGFRNRAMARMFELIELFHSDGGYRETLKKVWKENEFPEPVFEEIIEPPSSSVLMMLDYASIVISSVKGTQADVLRLIKDDPHITASGISSALNISVRHAERMLSELREKEKIERVGNKRSGSWKIV